MTPDEELKLNRGILQAVSVLAGLVAMQGRYEAAGKPVPRELYVAAARGRAYTMSLGAEVDEIRAYARFKARNG